MTLGVLRIQKGDNQGGEDKISEAVGLFQTAGDREGAFSGRMRLARLAIGTGRFESGERLNEELMEEARRAGDRATELQLLKNRGMLCMYARRSEEALEIFERTIEAHSGTGDLWSVSHTLGCMGNVHFDREDYRPAVDLYERSARLCRKVGNVYSEYYSLYNLALCLVRTGQEDAALARYREVLSLALRLDDRDGAKEIGGYITELEEKAGI
ncbi:MAG TPA: hypothetical protein DDW31_06535 [candidate division Zixibacteria bacterium]|nr:hypothetical protein [candidate division Zixibacteria bacterium]